MISMIVSFRYDGDYHGDYCFLHDYKHGLNIDKHGYWCMHMIVLRMQATWFGGLGLDNMHNSLGWFEKYKRSSKILKH